MNEVIETFIQGPYKIYLENKRLPHIDHELQRIDINSNYTESEKELMVKQAWKDESTRKLGYFLDMFRVESFVFGPGSVRSLQKGGKFPEIPPF